jgi:starch synthase
MFLMPSQFEPCGLSQMIALRYGCVPIVRETGGLRDTVLSYNHYNNAGNGFTFFNYNAHDMLFTIRRALRYYHEHHDVWHELQERGMNGDYSWGASAETYLSLYMSILPKAQPDAAAPVPAAEPAPTEAKQDAEETPAAQTEPEKPEAAPAKKPAKPRAKKAAGTAAAAKTPRKPRAKKTEKTAE